MLLIHGGEILHVPCEEAKASPGEHAAHFLCVQIRRIRDAGERGLGAGNRILYASDCEC